MVELLSQLTFGEAEFNLHNSPSEAESFYKCRNKFKKLGERNKNRKLLMLFFMQVRGDYIQSNIRQLQTVRIVMVGKLLKKLLRLQKALDIE